MTAPVRRGAQLDVKRRRDVRGEEREQLRQVLAIGYRAGASIRALGAAHDDLSYGLTRTLLLEAGVTMRSRARRPKPTP
ncbi:helix-turn-helix domain-containing protein [Streptomycetaceae bacterium NBC_01309]